MSLKYDDHPDIDKSGFEFKPGMYEGISPQEAQAQVGTKADERSIATRIIHTEPFLKAP